MDKKIFRGFLALIALALIVRLGMRAIEKHNPLNALDAVQEQMDETFDEEE